MVMGSYIMNMTKTLLYLAKEPDDGVISDLESFSNYDITVCACNPGYVDYYKLLGYNVITHHKFFTTVDMRFDTVIGNPPYQSGKNSNFYVEFIKHAAKLTKEGGIVSLIIPNRFILPHTPAAKSLRECYQVEQLIVDVNNHFPGVGTNIGMFKARVSSTGHHGDVDVVLSGGDTIQWDFVSPLIPSRKPTLDGVNEWRELMVKNNYNIVSKQPTDTDQFVYVCRQWKTKGGVPYFDAHVGPSGDKRDGKYILTTKPQELCEFLRSTDLAGKIHKLFGDQMNIWPFLWDYLPII